MWKTMNTQKTTQAMLLVVLVGSAVSAAEVQPNLGEAAKAIARATVDQMKTRMPATGKDRVAVLLFGDRNRKYPKNLGNLGPQLQGAILESLKDELTTATSGDVPMSTKFSVPLYETMVDAFVSNPTDVGGLTDQNIAVARNILGANNFKVGLVGHFEVDGDTLSKETISAAVTVKVTAIFASDTYAFDLQLSSSEILLHLVNGANNPTVNQNDENTKKLYSRFDIEIFAKARNQAQFEKIPLAVVTQQGSPLFNELILLIDPVKFKGQPFEIRVTNKATPNSSISSQSRKDEAIMTTLTNHPTKETDRTFLLASYIDGVSIIKRKELGPNNVAQFAKDVRYYPFVSKYVLTGPNRLFEADPASTDPRFDKSKLVDTNGPGHSVLIMKGFLKIADDGRQSVSGQFLFGDEKQSIGQEFVGTGVSQIGIMSFYFFAEQLEGDKTVAETSNGRNTAGTVEGSDIPTPVVKVGVRNIYKIPAETWHIIYQYNSANDPSTVPVQP
ncbi:MAG: hypothetical protein U0835_03290 [Isosphaeraceae bacterium]